MNREEVKQDELATHLPTPWSVEERGSRARVVAADGNQVISGMNIWKAQAIVDAVNRDAAAHQGPYPAWRMPRSR